MANVADVGITPDAATFGICTVCGAARGWGRVETADLTQIGMMCSKDPTHVEINVVVEHHDV